MSLVSISLVGNLTKPPEQMYFASGHVKTTMHVAVNGRKSGPSEAKIETTDFYKIETWGKLAELAGKYLAKGNQVAVTGRLSLDHWVDKQGKNRVTPVVEANQLSLPPKNKPTSPDDQLADFTAPSTSSSFTNGSSTASFANGPASRGRPAAIRGELDVSDESDESSSDTDDSDDTEYGVPDNTDPPAPNRQSRRRSTAYSTA